MSRCNILATLQPNGQALRCPTDTRSFHFHGVRPGFALLTGRPICSHRHKTELAAVHCTRTQGKVT